MTFIENESGFTTKYYKQDEGMNYIYKQLEMQVDRKTRSLKIKNSKPIIRKI